MKAEQTSQFNGADFLKWERETQDFYIRTSVGMAGLIASRNDKDQADCLESWYVRDERASNDQILSVMQDRPEYHPRAIILAVIEKKCGKLIYSSRN